MELYEITSGDCRLFEHLGIEHFCDKNVGEAAVNKSIALSRDISLDAGLSDISVFLRRIARAESNFGRHINTYRQGYFGGIWQVDRIGYDETKNTHSHPSLKRIYASVEKIFTWGGMAGIRWLETRWDDCTIPAYSCVAARIFLSTISEPVPSSLEEQARYWKKYYNTESGAGTIEHFINANKEFSYESWARKYDMLDYKMIDKDEFQD